MSESYLNYELKVNENEVNSLVADVKHSISQHRTDANFRKCLSLIDLTSLNANDPIGKGAEMGAKVSNFSSHFPGIQNVAAICVYPPLVKAVRDNLSDKAVKIAAVGAGFPSSQTFIEVKELECKRTVEAGADEIDIVISLGTFLSGDHKTVYNEIAAIKKNIGNAHLKVILETGALPTYDSIRLASLISMEAGCDFIKTSTGKMEPAATLEAAAIMCLSIKDYYNKHKIKIGFKPAGGIVTPDDALGYLLVVERILGDEWTNPELFRLGASRLANNLLSEITGKVVNYY
ncbi:deoxyribose-phosphate aldolase [Williamwhitmania taraxaci]|uniref:Deoxyribose-phosphate aldolase n=1 Tax=Williamwhitmania taraxaci TaxID=1640674 RepID=A0A1G6GZR2_9BACT|nr:deoxyribose-phosphate aldolase [Williamwhitmania taraxaci]SDB87441.1 deoxyribose-phosphate aldolase [Williamwhitmania taraxaci]